jgi:hypothetical protein
LVFNLGEVVAHWIEIHVSREFLECRFIQVDILRQAVFCNGCLERKFICVAIQIVVYQIDLHVALPPFVHLRNILVNFFTDLVQLIHPHFPPVGYIGSPPVRSRSY